MKILLIHTYYQVKGGEDIVFEQEFNLLRKKHDVKILTFINKPGLKGIFQFIFSIWNIFAADKLKKNISVYKPDLIHIHNWHYASGPIIIRVAKSNKIPVILTLHNYRLLCPSGSLMNNGKLFTESINAKFPWKAIRYKVFRESYILTFWLSFIVWFHRVIGTWNLVDKYIVLTSFAQQLYENSTLNLNPESIIIKPNFVTAFPEESIKKSFYLYVGRLSEEKGTEVLLTAFVKSKKTLKIAGNGPLLEKVKKASFNYSNIQYEGILNQEEVRHLMKGCTALIFPSIWFEGMPMVILEAFSQGIPVIASNFGVMSTMIKHGVDGMHFNVNDPNSLVSVIDVWSNLNESEKDSFSVQALNTYKKLYTEEINYEILFNIYNSLIK
ncbi:glycosyltransferase [Fibrella arboris]|uniref:glycosyltransferase n=1 Tax=Fibrella arboris TaxID=3242486 RepID=UPI0035213C82